MKIIVAIFFVVIFLVTNFLAYKIGFIDGVEYTLNKFDEALDEIKKEEME